MLGSSDVALGYHLHSFTWGISVARWCCSVDFPKLSFSKQFGKHMAMGQVAQSGRPKRNSSG